MATAFEVGDKFREKARQLLARANSSLPQQLKDDLEDVLEKPQPTVVSFKTLRELKKHLKDEGQSFVVTADILSLIFKISRKSDPAIFQNAFNGFSSFCSIVFEKSTIPEAPQW